ncbi:integral membrane sensor signal transduction histidine kinase [Candidatus Magnetobacterium bavaricum]|uniref:Signal transduction histidine-protein kinase/phosphatase MprB n=1 Tax=Candidatus Magnetobacterium bavaricum TaxID=29290 RepID=A0A0F3GX21_9BACT|nr:integral membrane sensor signal transduction histidine kinase [Candidatus Magnetobacterium bavaricum]
MKTKIFLSFLSVIVVAGVSNVIFRYATVRDFDNYRTGIEDANIYWVLASVESSYEDNALNHVSLMEAIHWALMLGLDAVIYDADGRAIMDYTHVLQHTSRPMRQKMAGIIGTRQASSTSREYDILAEGKKVGMVRFTPLVRDDIRAKEEAFKRRAMRFMLASLAITGVGSLLLALLFSTLLSLPLKRLKEGVARVASGDFSMSIAHSGSDELSALTASFNHMAGRLKRNADVRKHVMADITHQLRTPLTIIKANAEAVIDGVVEHSGATQNIMAEADRLMQLIKGIEDLTHAESGFFKPHNYSNINLKDFLSEVLDRYRQVALKKSLELSLCGGDVIVNTDGEILATILDNLLSNAIRYTSEGGVGIEYGSDIAAVWVKIRDTGTGISAEELPLVFERFYKGRHSNGMGIGLAIVQEQVSIIGAQITISSALGQGTEVALVITQSKEESKRTIF